MTETQQFLATMQPRITEAETALHNGDPGPRIAMWSRADPLTLFGAAMNGSGVGPDQAGLRDARRAVLQLPVLRERDHRRRGERRPRLHRRPGAHHRVDQWRGPQPYVLRVTTIFRREGGEWKVIHRHGDALAAGSAETVGRLTPPGDLPAR